MMNLMYDRTLDFILNDTCVFNGIPLVAGNVVRFKQNSTVLVDDRPLHTDGQSALVGLITETTMTPSPGYGSMCLSVLLVSDGVFVMCKIPHYFIDELVA